MSIKRFSQLVLIPLDYFLLGAVKNTVVLTNQRKLNIWTPTFVMPIPRYKPVQSKKYKVVPILWDIVTPGAAAIRMK